MSEGVSASQTGCSQAEPEVSALRASPPDAGRFAHFGDPCIYCRTPHDDVKPGPCKARLSVLGYAKVMTRWDGVEHYRWLTSDGKAHEVWSHVSNHAQYYHFGLSDELTNPPQWLGALMNPLSRSEAMELAQAIEARRAATTGAVHESAVATPCAQVSDKSGNTGDNT